MGKEGGILRFDDYSDRDRVEMDILGVGMGKLLSIRRFKNKRIFEEDLGYDYEQDKIDKCILESNERNEIKIGLGRGKVLIFSLDK